MKNLGLLKWAESEKNKVVPSQMVKKEDKRIFVSPLKKIKKTIKK